MQSYFVVQRSDNFEGMTSGYWIIMEAYERRPAASNLEFARRAFPDAYVKKAKVTTSDPFPVYEQMIAKSGLGSPNISTANVKNEGGDSTREYVTTTEIVDALVRDGQIKKDCVQNQPAKDDFVTLKTLDLNQDGVDEYLVTGKNSCTCGAQKCFHWLYGMHDNELKLLMPEVMADRIDVQKEKSRGYLDIMAMALYRGEVGYMPYRFDGTSYQPAKANIEKPIAAATEQLIPPATPTPISVAKASEPAANEEKRNPASNSSGKSVDRIEVKDGSVLAGEIAGGKVQFQSSFGEIDISLDEVRGFSDGKLSLADGTVITGAFSEGEIVIATGAGSLSVEVTEIMNVARGRFGNATLTRSSAKNLILKDKRPVDITDTISLGPHKMAFKQTYGFDNREFGHALSQSGLGRVIKSRVKDALIGEVPAIEFELDEAASRYVRNTSRNAFGHQEVTVVTYFATLGDVTGITFLDQQKTLARVEYTVKYQATPFVELFLRGGHREKVEPSVERESLCRLYDDGWRVVR